MTFPSISFDFQAFVNAALTLITDNIGYVLIAGAVIFALAVSMRWFRSILGQR